VLKKEPKMMSIHQTKFILEFVWKPIPVLERLEKKPESPSSEGEAETAEAG